MDTLLQERRGPVEDAEARSRIGAIEHIARQRLADSSRPLVSGMLRHAV